MRQASWITAAVGGCLLIALVAMLHGCGGSGGHGNLDLLDQNSPAGPDHSNSEPPAARELPDITEEIKQYTPAEVDSGLSAMLSAELARVIASAGNDEVGAWVEFPVRSE